MPVLILCAGAARAEDIGEVVWVNGSVDLRRQSEQSAARPKMPLRVGDRLFTGAPGLTRLLFFVDVAGRVEGRVPQLINYLNLGDGSDAEIATHSYVGVGGPKARFVLKSGTAYALFANVEGATYEIETPTAVAIATGTAFVVSHHGGVTQVVTLSGTVLVQSLVRREQDQVTVTAGRMTSVPGSGKPGPSEPASLERLRWGREGLEFMGGGRGESLTVADAVRSGRDVPPAGQLHLVLRPHPEVLDPCPFPSAPTCIPPEPVDALGNLDIHF